jgi:glycosyltransferase involved in cell wall biosynthesis
MSKTVVARVAIIQPWLPQYRVPFFEELIREAAAIDIDVHVFHGRPPESMAARDDAVETAWATELPTKFFSCRGRTLNWKSLAPFRREGPYDLVIVEQALKNLETYFIRLFGRTKRLAFWGHGKTYTENSMFLVERLKRLLTRSGDWFFAYTLGGAKAVVEAGFAPDRVTILNNSVDTRALQRDISQLDGAVVDDFKQQNNLSDRTALYIGALDEGKRISWLIQAASLAHELDPDFRLLVVGEGRDRPLVEAAAARHEWVVYKGSMFGSSKALALAASKIIVMPGRVGLAAVDSFAAARPIVTTEWPLHAPEFEYLENGTNALIIRDDAWEYGQAIVALLKDEEQLLALSRGCKESAKEYSIERMANNFLFGLRKSLNS